MQSEAAPSTVLDAMAHQLRAAADAMLRFREDAAQARARAAAGAEAEKACAVPLEPGHPFSPLVSPRFPLTQLGVGASTRRAS